MNSSSTAVAVLATPLEVTYQEEQALGQIARMLNQPHLKKKERANLLYHRGILFDRIGLKALALLDFQEAVSIQPDFSKAYNLLGLYMVQSQDFSSAYEAFDSVLELDPKADYIYLNRGIALYYGQRMKLAREDLEQATQLEPSDPYRWMWWYFAMHETGQGSVAKQKLKQLYWDNQGKRWGWSLLGVLTDDLSHAQLLQDISQDAKTNQLLAQRLCEAYFYIGKQAQLENKPYAALSYFRLALSNNVQSFLEHRFSRLEVERLAGAELSLKTSKS